LGTHYLFLLGAIGLLLSSGVVSKKELTLKGIRLFDDEEDKQRFIKAIEVLGIAIALLGLFTTIDQGNKAQTELTHSLDKLTISLDKLDKNTPPNLNAQYTQPSAAIIPSPIDKNIEIQSHVSDATSTIPTNQNLNPPTLISVDIKNPVGIKESIIDLSTAIATVVALIISVIALLYAIQILPLKATIGACITSKITTPGFTTYYTDNDNLTKINLTGTAYTMDISITVLGKDIPIKHIDPYIATNRVSEKDNYKPCKLIPCAGTTRPTQFGEIKIPADAPDLFYSTLLPKNTTNTFCLGLIDLTPLTEPNQEILRLVKLHITTLNNKHYNLIVFVDPTKMMRPKYLISKPTPQV